MIVDSIERHKVRKLVALVALGILVPCLAPSGAQAAKELSLAEAIVYARGHRSERAQAEADLGLARVGLLQAAMQRAQLSVEGIYSNRFGRVYASRSMCGTSSAPCTLNTSGATVDGIASLTVPLWSGWSVESSWKRARKLEEAADMQKAALDRQLTLEATRAYWTVRQLDLLLQVSQKAVNRNDEVVTMTKLRSSAGIAPVVDYTRAQTRRLRQLADITALTGQLEQARAQLAAALQIDDEVVLTEAPPDQPALLPPLDRLLTDAGRWRPEVHVARAQSEAQELQTRSIRGALWPQLNLVGSANIHAEGSGTPPVAVAAGVVIDWKVFDSLSTYIAARQSELQHRKLADGQTRLSFLVATEVRSAYAGLKAAGDRRDPLKQAQEAADTGVEIIRRRYRAGTALLIELLQAEDELQQVELDLVGNAVDIAQAQGELWAAAGQR